jgi:hypothetical protein
MSIMEQDDLPARGDPDDGLGFAQVDPDDGAALVRLGPGDDPDSLVQHALKLDVYPAVQESLVPGSSLPARGPVDRDKEAAKYGLVRWKEIEQDVIVHPAVQETLAPLAQRTLGQLRAIEWNIALAAQREKEQRKRFEAYVEFDGELARDGYDKSVPHFGSDADGNGVHTGVRREWVPPSCVACGGKRTGKGDYCSDACKRRHAAARQRSLAAIERHAHEKEARYTGQRQVILAELRRAEAQHLAARGHETLRADIAEEERRESTLDEELPAATADLETLDTQLGNVTGRTPSEIEALRSLKSQKTEQVQERRDDLARVRRHRHALAVARKLVRQQEMLARFGEVEAPPVHCKNCQEELAPGVEEFCSGACQRRFTRMDVHGLAARSCQHCQRLFRSDAPQIPAFEPLALFDYLDDAPTESHVIDLCSSACWRCPWSTKTPRRTFPRPPMLAR